MTITALPTPPTRSDPVNFASRADAFLAALPTFQAEANEMAVAMNLNETSDTSASSVLIGLGAKTFTVTAGKSWQPGMYLVIADTALPSTNGMWGQVTSYSSTTLIVDVQAVRGSGTIAAWTISQSAPNAEFANAIHLATDKASPVDADELPLSDSAASWGLKKLTWANLKATIKSYLSGAEFPIGATTPAAGSFTTVSASGQIAVGGDLPMSGTGASAFADFSSFNKGIGLGTGHPGFPDALITQVANGTWGADVIVASRPPAGGSGVERIRISSTGLAVTGALSATGNGMFGTATPAGRLTVNHTSGRGNGIAINTAGGQGTISWVDSLGLAYDAAAHVFYNGATEEMRLDASGNLGLGVTPSGWATMKAFQIGNSTLFNSGYDTYVGTNAYYNAGFKYMNSSYASHYLQTAGQHQWYTAPSGTAGNAITFTQAMTLTASGELLVGTTSAAVNPTSGVNFTNGGVATWNIGVNHPTGSASGNGYMSFVYDTTAIGTITQNGTTAVAYNTTSDHRLKENVRPANAARFMDIEFVDFEWVDGRHDCGVIADQLQSVYPDLVLGAKDATEVRTVEITPAVKDEDGNVTQEAVTEEQTFPVYQQVNYMGLIGRMGTRVQQLQRTVDEQAELILLMNARLTALEQA
jgi:hypothetical protein